MEAKNDRKQRRKKRKKIPVSLNHFKGILVVDNQSKEILMGDAYKVMMKDAFHLPLTLVASMLDVQAITLYRRLVKNNPNGVGLVSYTDENFKDWQLSRFWISLDMVIDIVRTQIAKKRQIKMPKTKKTNAFMSFVEKNYPMMLDKKSSITTKEVATDLVITETLPPVAAEQAQLPEALPVQSGEPSDTLQSSAPINHEEQ